MEYDIYLHYGHEGTVSQSVQEVEEVLITEEAYFFYGVDGQLLFAAPREKVVYVKKK